MVGPLVLAFIPMPGVGQLGKLYAVNVMIWNAWGILYAVFGALITAIQVNPCTKLHAGCPARRGTSPCASRTLTVSISRSRKLARVSPSW